MRSPHSFSMAARSMPALSAAARHLSASLLATATLASPSWPVASTLSEIHCSTNFRAALLMGSASSLPVTTRRDACITTPSTRVEASAARGFTSIAGLSSTIGRMRSWRTRRRMGTSRPEPLTSAAPWLRYLFRLAFRCPSWRPIGAIWPSRRRPGFSPPGNRLSCLRRRPEVFWPRPGDGRRLCIRCGRPMLGRGHRSSPGQHRGRFPSIASEGA